MNSHTDRVLGADYLAGLEKRPLEEVRAMRAECQAIETGLSYLRRLVQGRLDIVGVERERRRSGGDPADLAAVIDRLPEILADRGRPPGPGRLPQHMAPGEIDAEMDAELEQIVAGHDMEDLPSMDDETLAQLQEDLEAFERKVSVRRRELFDRIDTLQGEITRRYKTGEATVETLLQ